MPRGAVARTWEHLTGVRHAEVVARECVHRRKGVRTERNFGLDQPVGGLDLHAMVRDTVTSLDALTDARAQVRARLPLDARARLERLEPVIRATLDPIEAYNDVPGRDPQNR